MYIWVNINDKYRDELKTITGSKRRDRVAFEYCLLKKKMQPHCPHCDYKDLDAIIVDVFYLILNIM